MKPKYPVSKKIGQVTFINHNSKSTGTEYSDSSEEGLLDIFLSKDPNRRLDQVFAKGLNWPLRYHLSPARENLLNWYKFPKNSSLLEVGAGCGALTGLFCNKLEKVTALELSEKRAYILALRHRSFSNLNVVAENIQSFSSNDKYDFVTCVGVLEYAGSYIESEDPYLTILKILKNYLKPSGRLVLAIENKLGIKYWSGCREDHTGRGFDSILGYPFKGSVRTFGRLELEELLIEAGFKQQKWYYPLPDYKTPAEIFSDKFLPGKNKLFASGIFPTIDYSRPRVHFFPEILVMNSLIRNDLFQNFANSFLVFASVK